MNIVALFVWCVCGVCVCVCGVCVCVCGVWCVCVCGVCVVCVCVCVCHVLPESGQTVHARFGGSFRQTCVAVAAMQGKRSLALLLFVRGARLWGVSCNAFLGSRPSARSVSCRFVALDANILAFRGRGEARSSLQHVSQECIHLSDVNGLVVFCERPF